MSDIGIMKICVENYCEISFSDSTRSNFYYKNHTVMDGKRLLCYRFTMQKLGDFADFYVFVLIILFT